MTTPVVTPEDWAHKTLFVAGSHLGDGAYNRMFDEMVRIKREAESGKALAEAMRLVADEESCAWADVVRDALATYRAAANTTPRVKP